MEHLESICRFCLVNRTKGFGIKSFTINENIQSSYEIFTKEKLPITSSRPKLICLDCKTKFDYSFLFRNLILESQWKLNQLLPQENLEPFAVTVKQEIAFIDESSVVVKLEPEDDSEIGTFPVDPVSEEAPIFKTRKIQKVRNETNPRKSSRSAINRSYNENSPEPEENSLRKRGRPKKSVIKTVIDQKAFKIEVKEGSRESSPDLSSRFSDIPHHDSSDDDFKLPKNEFNQIISENKKSKKPEIFATCNICPKIKKVRLQDLDDFKIHNEYVHEDLENPFLGPYKCKTCSKVITSEVKMRKHVRLFHVFGNEKLCTTCGKKFYDRRAFYCHIDKNHGIRNVTCPLEGCGKMFNGKMNLGKHMKTHLPDGQRKVHVCDRCGSKYINKDNIKLHMTKCDGRTFKDHTLVKPRRKLNRLKCYLNLGFTPNDLN